MRVKNNSIFAGPQLPLKCLGGSMITSTSNNEAILVGCKDENDVQAGKTYKLTWQGEHLQWLTLPQKLKYPRTRTVAMWIPNSFTSCNSEY